MSGFYSTPAMGAAMRRRIDRLADARERRPSRPLGVGYYSERVRRDAAKLACAWYDAANFMCVDDDDVDLCIDLQIGALDAVHNRDRRAARTE